MSHTDIPRKVYMYFRKGISELSFLISVYNMILLQQLRGITFNFVFMISLLFIAVIIGWIQVKIITPTQTYINPASQDTMTSSYYLYEGILCVLNDEVEKAKEFFTKASALRKKWIDKDE